jgi:branched-chain amino acid transport system ATP-binding protein
MSLRVCNVSKSFGGLRVVRDVSLEVPLNGLVGMVGPNGAGKSTLFAVISGFLSASSGHIEFDGTAIDGLAPPRRARLGLVRTFQVPRPFTHLSVRENLAVAAPDQTGEHVARIFLQPWRIRREEQAQLSRADEVLGLLRLTAVANERAGRLSGGQLKLLELGRVLMTGPKFIMLDEPFAGVNPVLIDQLSELIVALNRRGTGFLIIEHNLTALSRLVPHLCVLDQGALIASGTPDAVLADSRVRQAYVGG